MSVIKLFQRDFDKAHVLREVGEVVVDCDGEPPLVRLQSGNYYVRNAYGQYIREAVWDAKIVPPSVPVSPPPDWTGFVQKYVVVCNCDPGDEHVRGYWDVTVTERPVEVPNTVGDSNTGRDSNGLGELDRRILAGITDVRCGWVYVEIEAHGGENRYVRMVVTTQDPGAERRRSSFSLDITDCDLEVLVETLDLVWGCTGIEMDVAGFPRARAAVRWACHGPGRDWDGITPMVALGAWMDKPASAPAPQPRRVPVEGKFWIEVEAGNKYACVGSELPSSMLGAQWMLKVIDGKAWWVEVKDPWND